MRSCVRQEGDELQITEKVLVYPEKNPFFLLFSFFLSNNLLEDASLTEFVYF